MAHTQFNSGAFPRPLAIIVRHAEREPIHDYSNALDACLTEKGKSDAFLFGKNMENIGPVTLYHSPVQRCVQTAECICAGMVSKGTHAHAAGSIFDLGGPYIVGPWHEIAVSIDRYGQTSFVRKWFNDEFSPDFIMPLDLAAATQLRILAGQLLSGDSSCINVTHDWNIMVLREYYFNSRHEDIGAPEYLDGLCAFMQDDVLHLIHHELERVIRMPI
jgi:bisphosphoglycerate-dependent phosphoglycerate mutase